MSHLHPAGVPSPATPLERLVRYLFITQEQELTCAEVYVLLDQYADLDLTGIDMAASLPLVQLHLSLCTECAEAYVALRQLLLTPNTAL